ncbi:uncharacterized protein ALTATR162_LOCUS12114 [Alternaria atra]|uniref:Uncharacterized protein n=1 Tax=Alternaria atra TaxID=119953 RepID=A0A8J2IE26_9PLEO|nr:uncharacterized protein ALTATR162_LOCUS12114 [Alternaria atra]CAG5189929.1 unnamed protein product [Alternaria atra]
MDQSWEMLSSDSLLDAEGDADSSLGETSWPEIDAPETQAADVLCNNGAIDGSQASGHASIEPCLPEHPAALTASQTGATVDQAIDQAMASILEPEMSEPSPTEAAITSTSDQEPEPRTISPPESPRIESGTEPEAAMAAHEKDTQLVTRDLRRSVESPAIEEQCRANNDPIADDHVASASSSMCHAEAGTTSAVPHTASHAGHVSSEGITHGNKGLPMSDSEDEELFESIIIDDNGGQPIIIDSSDGEMNVNSRPNPRRRAQRKRISPQSPEMVNWTSKEYGTTSAAGLTTAWEKVWEQWGWIHTKADRQLAQTLDQFHGIMSDVRSYELWNEEYRKHDGRRAFRAWGRYGIEKRVRKLLRPKRDERLMRKFGRALKRLQEAEEEHHSIALTMGDGDSEDCDYVPTQTWLPHSHKSQV